MNNYCMTYGKEITKDEIGANKKLIDKDIDTYQCLSCLSQELGIPEDVLLRKIEEFKDEGCILFQ